LYGDILLLSLYGDILLLSLYGDTVHHYLCMMVTYCYLLFSGTVHHYLYVVKQCRNLFMVTQYLNPIV